MMSSAAAAAACTLLDGCRTTGATLPALPGHLRPATRADGYAIQAALERRNDVPLYGWKIAATSVAGQAHIGVDGPLAGRLLAERVMAPGQACPFAANRMRVAEIEFAFRMAITLPPRATPRSLDEVMAAVATLHPAIEIPDSRFARFEEAGAAQLIADNACAHFFRLGEAAPDGWRALDLAAHRVTARINEGQPVAGMGSNVLGDPWQALLWLANELSAIGEPLAAGQVVTTGTCVITLPIVPGDHIEGDMGALGTVSLTMAPS